MNIVFYLQNFHTRSAEEDVDYEPGVGAVGAYPGEDHGHEGGEGYAGANTDPTHIVDGALLCFNGKHVSPHKSLDSELLYVRHLWYSYMVVVISHAVLNGIFSALANESNGLVLVFVCF